MAVYDQTQAKTNRVFISYSSIDRLRTNGLGLLLEAMGHQVFHDHRTIKPGMRWKSALQEGLDDADTVMVFWTRHAARSDWVRKEYEYFSAHYPDRPLVPVLGDETPLPEILKTRQQADFAPVVNEVLAMKRKMKNEGAGATQIEQAVLKRLDEAGIEVKGKKQRRLLFLLLGFPWLLTLLRHPLAMAQKLGSGAVEKTAQLTIGQAAALAVAAVIGLSSGVPLADELTQLGRRLTGREPNIVLGGAATDSVHFVEAESSHDAINQRLDDLYANLSWLSQCRDEIAALKIGLAELGVDATRFPPLGAGGGFEPTIDSGVVDDTISSEVQQAPDRGELDVQEAVDRSALAASRLPDANPSDLVATAVWTGLVRLTWSNNASNEQGFEIERCEGAACSEFARIGTASASATSYDDVDVRATVYRYRVRAFNAAGESAYTNADSATALVFNPGAIVMPRIKDPARAREIATRSYPANLQAGGIKGSVVVNVWIDESGTTSLPRACEPHIKRSSGNRELDRAALQAVREFEFEPASMSGRTIPLCVEVPITFE